MLLFLLMNYCFSCIYRTSYCTYFFYLIMMSENLKYYLTILKNFFMVAAPRLWNSLPKELHAITNVNSFKEHIKTYLFKTLYWWAILYSVLTCMHIYSFYFLFFNALLILFLLKYCSCNTQLIILMLSRAQ